MILLEDHDVGGTTELELADLGVTGDRDWVRPVFDHDFNVVAP